MNRKQLWVYAIREENSLRANAAAWRMALDEAPDEDARRAIRSLLRALEYARDISAHTQRALGALYRREEV